MSEIPSEIHIQYTYEQAEKEITEDYGSYDEDSEDDESPSLIASVIGSSIEEIEFESWDDIPEGYEPCDSDIQEEYYDYLALNRSS